MRGGWAAAFMTFGGRLPNVSALCRYAVKRVAKRERKEQRAANF